MISNTMGEDGWTGNVDRFPYMSLVLLKWMYLLQYIVVLYSPAYRRNPLKGICPDVRIYAQCAYSRDAHICGGIENRT